MLKISDIARRTGVSSSTVSFVLNDRHEEARISETTRQKVLTAAEEMGYRANHGARAMRTGNTRMIGVLGGDLAWEQVGAMVAGALEEIEAHDYTLKLLPTPLGGSADLVEGAVRRSSELRLQGAIGLHLSESAVALFEAEAKRYKYPLLLLDTRAPNSVLSSVVSEDACGIAAAVEHLAGLGHRRIALIAGAATDAIVPLRASSFRAALHSHGLSLPDHYVRNGDFTLLKPSVDAARALLSLPDGERPTALFCMGDFIAMAALQIASALELRVPQDLSVIGFADFAMAQFANPPLTTVRQDFTEMGRVAARQILQLCGQSEKNETSTETSTEISTQFDSCIEVPTQLVVRGTCGPAPKQKI